MAPTDVIKHDLPIVQFSREEWEGPAEGVPMPDETPSAPLPQVPPAVTTRVTPEELDEGPYSSVGLMRFKFPADGGKIKAGTGWVVTENAFITAGHCVHYQSLGGWIVEGGFCPRFDNACPQSFVIKSVYSLRGWVESQDRTYDMAACVVTRSFTSEELPLIFSTSPLPGLRFMALGYPATPTPKYPFNGKRMWKSIGELSGVAGGRQWAANDLNNGASGGPWCEVDNNDIVSGINTQRKNKQNLVGSPFFSNGLQNLYNAVRKG